MPISAHPDLLAKHPCIDCKVEVADDPLGLVHRVSRKIVTADGEPKRCDTHARAFAKRQRKQARARAVERTYGISAEDSHALLLLQGGRCWLCQKATGATKALAVDHDHATDEVRGRLCGPCNQFIGRLGDDPAAAQRLVAYLTGDTPWRRLKAAQTLMERRLPAYADRPLFVHSIVESGGELYANWCNGDGINPEQWYRTLVRLSDGTWTTIRPENVFPRATDAEPRVTTAGECGSCHALPDQPHTEYCNGTELRVIR